MSSVTIVSWALLGAHAMLAVAMLLAGYRVFMGPRAQDRVLAYMRAHLADRRVGILCYEGEQDLFSAATAVEVLGAPGDNEAHAHRLFEALHRLDRAALDCIYAPLPSSEGLGLAVRNRLLKAAAHTVIEV